MKVRFGVIGTNFISDWIITGGLMDDRFEVAAIYSRTEEQGRAFADKYGVKQVFTNLEEMAKSDMIDAVYVASPNAFHYEQTLLFISYGKHVLCEKAFCSNADEAREMIAAALNKGVLLMEAMKPTLSPNFRQVIANLGNIGKIRKYFACYCQYSSRYDSLKEGIISNAWRPDMSNGALVDIGVYTIYPMVVLFGKPQSIKASGVLLDTGVDAEGSVVFTYDGMDATVLFSKISTSNLPAEVQGEDGTIWLDRINVVGDVKLQLRGKEEVNLTQPQDGDDNYHEVKHFIDLIEQGKQESEINTHANTIAVMEVMDEIRRQLGVVYPTDKKA